MSLLDKYTNAAVDTNAGKARTNTAAVGDNSVPGVNFMDAGARSGTTDSMQANFQQGKRDTTTFVQGTETTIAAGERKGLSRWYGRALNYAFTDPKATGNSIQNSTWTTYKTLRPDTKDAWADNSTNFHRWTPTGKFAVSTTLSEFAKVRAAPKTAPTSAT